MILYKKILIIFVSVLFIFTSYEVIASNEDEVTSIQIIHKKINVSNPIIIDNEEYLQIHINESETYLLQPGNPILPIITKEFIFPFGTKILNSNIKYNKKSYKLSKKILPCEKINLLDPSRDEILIESSTEDSNYEKIGLFPETSFFIKSGSGLLNGKHVLFFTIYLIPQYNPSENLLISPCDVEIKIEYQIDEKPLLNQNNDYDMVIIIPQKFSTCIKPLIDHKKNVGISTFFKTTEEIYKEYNGRDNPEKIKFFIKDAIEEYGIKYVFLIGDIYHVPMRKTAVSWNYFGDLVAPDIITDLYYADIYNETGSFSIWDSNKDEIYSEIRMIMNNRPYNETLEIVDEVEGIPDVIVGRIPCSNTGDVKNIVKKIITYETNTYGNDWFNRLILMGGDTFPFIGGISEGEFVTEYISSYMPDFQSIKLWTSLNTFKPMNINRELSKGAGFVTIHFWNSKWN